MKYNPNKIEKRWQRYWEAKNFYITKDSVPGRNNFMLLAEFPYPSGDLHIGHWFTYSVCDILARYLRMNGYNVMYPIGFDAFGLPAENAAIQRNINPRDWTKKNIATMTKQLKSTGAMFDWSRVIETIDPDYYKWTQWMFLKMYEDGLAYRGKALANWCPKDKTILANEQVINGCCERCGAEVIQKEIEQWLFRITQFADALIDDIETLDWPEKAKIAQRNWIGRSEGALIKFQISNSKSQIAVFTTRADTLFGATYLVLAPEHLMIQQLAGQISNIKEIEEYIAASRRKTELERISEVKNKTGVELKGVTAINPINNEEIPVWVADYVLGHYGTGAIMAVPAHDQRDLEFAKKYNLEIREVINADDKLVNSGKFSGMTSKEAGRKIVEELKKGDLADFHKQYRLHDWILSRQRYWGVPIPMINCQSCGYLPVPEKDLPIELPKLADFKPSDEGRSPLAKATKWLKVKCPKCGGQAERETDTMDTFVDSSWYFMRYSDPKNKEIFADKNKMNQWLPVPMYIGGAEHNTMHLLYSRFFTKALHKLGYVDFNEPFAGRRTHGVILGPDGQKMSKSRGNVVDPDAEVKKYGADTIRMNFAFMGPFDQDYIWNPESIAGVSRFLNRVWNFVQKYNDKKLNLVDDREILKLLHRAIKSIGEDIRQRHFNTGVSGLMKLLNGLEEKIGDRDKLDKKNYEAFLKILAPYAPHLAEELWVNVLGNENSIHLEDWPKFDSNLIIESEVNLIVQINGKVRDTIRVKKGLTENEIKDLVLNSEKIVKYTAGAKIKKFIYIKDRLTNIVI